MSRLVQARKIAKALAPPVLTSLVRRLLKPPIPGRGNPPAHATDSVQIAREHFNSAVTKPIPSQVQGSPRWNTILLEMRKRILASSCPWNVIDCAQQVVEFDNRQLAEGLGPLLDQSHCSLVAEFPQFIDQIQTLSDSSFSHPRTMSMQKGRLVSNAFFQHLRTLLICLSYIKPSAVCELGGGYGGLARLWSLNTVCRPKLYAIVDFPESLFYSEVFLRSTLVDVDFRYITSSQKLTPTSGKPTILLCPIQFVDALSSITFDLALNTGSIQEMTEDAVSYWMAWLREQPARYFYSLNYFAQPLIDLAESANVWSPRLGPEWTVRMLRAEPAFVKQHSTRKYAEFLAEKAGAKESQEAAFGRYRFLKDRVLDDQTLLEAIDIVRVFPATELIWDLLSRCMKERSPTPKEAYWLGSTLRASEDKLPTGNREEFHKYLEQLEVLRNSAEENIYDAVRLNSAA